MAFFYSNTDLVSDLSESAKSISEFDKIFEDKWRELHEADGIFRYKLKIDGEKVLQGRYGFLLQLNVDRSSNRRAPEEIKSVNQAFDHGKFNFSQVSLKEHIFYIKNIDDNCDDSSKHLIIVNASPICYGHSLLCPRVDDLYPQIITAESLRLALQIMFLSNNRNLRIGFNSLCGMASVNHLHYHILILNYRLPVETSKCSHLKGPLYELDDYPAKCFCFQIQKKSEISNVADQVLKLISFLMNNNIAHNLYLTRGASFDRPDEETVRILVWVRRSSYGAKEMSAFNLAICEFSGQFPCKNKENYENLKEEDVVSILEETILPVFNDIKQECIALFD